MIFHFILYILIASVSVLANPDKSLLIVGGKKVTNISEAPFMVALLSKYNQILCGGSIISSRLILTAAHCLDDLKYSKIKSLKAGATDYSSLLLL